MDHWVVVGGAGTAPTGPDGVAAGRPAAAALADRVAAAEADGLARKAAIAQVAKATGVPKREVYDAVVAARQSSPRS